MDFFDTLISNLTELGQFVTSTEAISQAPNIAAILAILGAFFAILIKFNRQLGRLLGFKAKPIPIYTLEEHTRLLEAARLEQVNSTDTQLKRAENAAKSILKANTEKFQKLMDRDHKQADILKASQVKQIEKMESKLDTSLEENKRLLREISKLNKRVQKSEQKLAITSIKSPSHNDEIETRLQKAQNALEKNDLKTVKTEIQLIAAKIEYSVKMTNELHALLGEVALLEFQSGQDTLEVAFNHYNTVAASSLNSAALVKAILLAEAVEHNEIALDHAKQLLQLVDCKTGKADELLLAITLMSRQFRHLSDAGSAVELMERFNTHFDADKLAYSKTFAAFLHERSCVFYKQNKIDRARIELDKGIHFEEKYSRKNSVGYAEMLIQKGVLEISLNEPAVANKSISSAIALLNKLEREKAFGHPMAKLECRRIKVLYRQARARLVIAKKQQQEGDRSASGNSDNSGKKDRAA